MRNATELDREFINRAAEGAHSGEPPTQCRLSLRRCFGLRFHFLDAPRSPVHLVVRHLRGDSRRTNTLSPALGINWRMVTRSTA
jgi:hypothetical protein